MYVKPTLQRFGSFRQLTLSGFYAGYNDLAGGFWGFSLNPPQEEDPILNEPLTTPTTS